MKVATIIPARSGSKSIPKKNIQLLDGKPLLSYSIKYSLNSNLVSDTIVSTDCSDIAEIATEYGASVPFLRPPEYAEDNSQDYQFMRHALDFLESQEAIYDAYILLRPTSPVRPPGLIEQALAVLEKFPQATSIRSMTAVSEHPYRIWMPLNDGSVAPIIDSVVEPYNLPRQSLPSRYFQTGDIEVVRRDTLLQGSVSGNHVYPLLIKHEDMVDIDSWTDLEKAAGKLNT